MPCVCVGMCVCRCELSTLRAVEASVAVEAAVARLLLLVEASLARLVFSCSSSLTLLALPFLCLCIRSLSNDLFDGERASQSLRARLECGSTAVSSRVLSLSGPLGLTDGSPTLPWILEVPLIYECLHV